MSRMENAENEIRTTRTQMMTPAELKSARKSLGLTAEQFAKVIGVTRDAVCKWESGKRPIPRSVELLIYLISLANSTK